MARTNAASEQAIKFADELIVDLRKIEPLASLGYFESGAYGVLTGVDGLSYGSNWALRMTNGGGTVVRLYISDPDAERLARAYASLLGRRDEIESIFGEKLHFRLWTYGATIEKRRYGSDGLDERNWPELRQEMIDRYLRLRDAIDPILPDIALV